MHRPCTAQAQTMHRPGADHAPQHRPKIEGLKSLQPRGGEAYPALLEEGDQEGAPLNNRRCYGRRRQVAVAAGWKQWMWATVPAPSS